MPNEMRNVWAKGQIVKLLDGAARDLHRGLQKVDKARGLTDALGDAQEKVASARRIADVKPAGGRALPPAIRRATETAATRLEALAKRVRETPITEPEKSAKARSQGANGSRPQGRRRPLRGEE